MNWNVMEWMRRCMYLLHRKRFARDLEQEARSHQEIRTAELEVAGLTHEEARREAQREFGSVLRAKEDSSEAWQFRPIEQLLSDAHYAVRQFARNPLFALASIVSLTLGIGATTAVFSVIYGVLLHPFPYAGADRMVSFRVEEAAGYNGFNNHLLLSARQLKDLQASPVIDGAIATDNWDMATTGEDLPQAVHVGKL